MKITIKENNKNVQEFNLLYDLVGWGHYNENITRKSLENTFGIQMEAEQLYGMILGQTLFQIL